MDFKTFGEGFYLKEVLGLESFLALKKNKEALAMPPSLFSHDSISLSGSPESPLVFLWAEPLEGERERVFTKIKETLPISSYFEIYVPPSLNMEIEELQEVLEKALASFKGSLGLVFGENAFGLLKCLNPDLGFFSEHLLSFAPVSETSWLVSYDLSLLTSEVHPQAQQRYKKELWWALKQLFRKLKVGG